MYPKLLCCLCVHLYSTVRKIKIALPSLYRVFSSLNLFHYSIWFPGSSLICNIYQFYILDIWNWSLRKRVNFILFLKGTYGRVRSASNWKVVNNLNQLKPISLRILNYLTKKTIFKKYVEILFVVLLDVSQSVSHCLWSWCYWSCLLGPLIRSSDHPQSSSPRTRAETPGSAPDLVRITIGYQIIIMLSDSVTRFSTHILVKHLYHGPQINFFVFAKNECLRIVNDYADMTMTTWTSTENFALT